MGGGISLNGKSILDLTYPIGSLYISKENVSPASLFGGTWEQVAEGYTLWTTTTSGEGGKKISAGLPNITGQTAKVIQTWESCSGAMYLSDYNSQAGGSGAYYYHARINIDASKSNSIYGNSNTVQPPAIKTYMWIRIS